MKVPKAILAIIIALLCTRITLPAAETVIRGVILDSQRKPIRGALVKAQAGYKIVTRFSQRDGRYQIPVPSGKYAVTADAFGYSGKRIDKDTTELGELNFTLTPSIQVTRLSGADIEQLLPDNPETRMFRAECISCHNLERLTMRRGSTTEEWQDFLPTMTRGRFPVAVDPRQNPGTSQAKFAVLTNALGKYFGPNAAYFGPDSDPPTLEQIKHPTISDAALSATIWEYEIPTPMPMAHSMSVDPDRRIAWWGEESHLANKIGRFDMETEKFTEYLVPTQNASVHTGIVGRDGRYWVTLPSGGDAKIVSVDPSTGQLTEYKWPGKKGNPHTLAIDKAGNLVMSGGSSGEIWTFDTETGKFAFRKFAVPPVYPLDSIAYWTKAPEDFLPAEVRATSYDIRVNSKGIYYFTLFSLGTLMSLDPATGETNRYHPPGTPSMRGMAIDAQDNVWFSNFNGHKLGKLARSGQIEQYQPPTLNATPYGILVDKAGSIWFSDLNGNNITRFDPKTKQFVEYPLPTREAGPKFMSLDAKGHVWFTEVMGAKIGTIDPGDGK